MRVSGRRQQSAESFINHNAARWIFLRVTKHIHTWESHIFFVEFNSTKNPLQLIKFQDVLFNAYEKHINYSMCWNTFTNHCTRMCNIFNYMLKIDSSDTKNDLRSIKLVLPEEVGSRRFKEVCGQHLDRIKNVDFFRIVSRRFHKWILA